MSNASVTPPMRVIGWNVHILASTGAYCFAGIFQLDDMVTFRDVLAEMRLCFEVPGPGTGADDWSDISFAFAGLVNAPHATTTANAYPNLVGPADLDQPVPAPPPASSSDPGEQSIARFHLVRHGHCSLPETASLASHLQAGCAHHISQPSRRHERRYLPPKKPSTDPRFPRLPLRRTVRTRGNSQSSSKRSASGSPKKNTGSDDHEEDVASMVAPPDMHIPPDMARQTIAAFRSSCLLTARKCAVTGKGRSWCISPVVGPAVQACHIIPQQHYHLYPDVGGHDDHDELEYSTRLHWQAWQRTWSYGNGILLLSHLHELFDNRLFSIHPETLRVRTFVPYDVICDYHGRKAQLPASVDRKALRHHYDMCCIENMAAQMPLIAPLSDDTGSPISSTTSPLVNRPRITATSGAKPSDVPGLPSGADENGPTHNAHGDPSKRTRSLEAEEGDATEDESRPTAKRRRTSQNNEIARYWEDGDVDPPHSPFWEGHITPSNSQHFLADVNWELTKIRC